MKKNFEGSNQEGRLDGYEIYSLQRTKRVVMPKGFCATLPITRLQHWIIEEGSELIIAASAYLRLPTKPKTNFSRTTAFWLHEAKDAVMDLTPLLIEYMWGRYPRRNRAFKATDAFLHAITNTYASFARLTTLEDWEMWQAHQKSRGRKVYSNPADLLLCSRIIVQYLVDANETYISSTHEEAWDADLQACDCVLYDVYKRGECARSNQKPSSPVETGSNAGTKSNDLLFTHSGFLGPNTSEQCDEIKGSLWKINN